MSSTVTVMIEGKGEMYQINKTIGMELENVMGLVKEFLDDLPNVEPIEAKRVQMRE